MVIPRTRGMSPSRHGAPTSAPAGAAGQGLNTTSRAVKFLGIPNPALNDLTKEWRQTLDTQARVAIAADLWKTDIFEARIAAAKLLTQARIRPDNTAWALIQSWVPEFDSWAIADHVCMAGQKRLVADPTRLDSVETWTTSDHMWTRRAALVITLR